MTSAEYAAAWLTQLAKDAEAGKPIESTEVQHQARLAVLSETTTMAAPSSASASPTPTTVLPTTVAPFVAGEPVPGVPAPVVPVAPPVDGQAPVVGVEGAPIDGSVVVTPEVTGAPAPTTTAVPTTTVTPAP